MKRTAKFFAILLAILTVASAVSAFAFGEFESEAGDYDDYGYYVYFDFEDYTGGHPLNYFRNRASRNSTGLASDPYAFVLTGQGNTHGTDITAQKEADGNTYMHHNYVGGNYGAVAVFKTIDQNGNDVLLGDSLEFSFRFRMSADQDEITSKIALVNIRRNGDNYTYLWADVYGNLYVQQTKGDTTNMAKVYTNGDGKTVGGDGEFMDIAFRWYDTTNTFSVLVNGDPVAEGIPFHVDYRTAAKVTKTYDDNFNVTGMTVAGGTGEGATRTIEFIRNDNSALTFTYDLDDLKLSRIETPQGGAVYYDNSFDGDLEGVSLIHNYGTYVYNTGASSSNLVHADGCLEVSSGQYVSFNDRHYQAFTQGNLVIEFSIKGTPTHESGRKGIVRINDSFCGTLFKPMFVDEAGNLYIDDNANARVEGYKLDGSEWLDIAIVAIKNTDNADKFCTFTSTTTKSTSNYSYTFAFYVNGNFVGVSTPKAYYKFSKSSYNSKLVTSSGFEYSITDYTTALDLSGLTLIDETTTANHKIYKSVVDGVTTYYDVTFDENGNQTKYSAMVLGSYIADDENIRILADSCFDAKLDNIKLYEGTAPEFVYAGANADERSTVVNVDFSKFTFPTENVNSRTGSSGADVLGSFITSGIHTAAAVHKDADGNAVTAATTKNADYATLTMLGGGWFDYFVPMPKKENGGFDFTYSFETSVKNLGFDAESAPEAINFFSLRLENDNGYTPSTMLTVDNNLNLFVSTTDAKLYNANGEAVKLDNGNWNKLRVDIHFVKSANSAELTASYFYNDEPLFLEDGSNAANITTPFAAAATQRLGGENVRFRYIPQLPDKTSLTLDVKNFTITSNARSIYEEVEAEQINFSGSVTEINFTLPKYSSESLSGKYEALALVKGSAKLPLVAVDTATGKVLIGIGGQYLELLDEDGKAIVLPEAGLPMTVIYNDADGMARYYVDGAPAYVELGVGFSPAADIGIYDATFAQLGATGNYEYVIFKGTAGDLNMLEEKDYSLVTSSIGKKDNAKIIGFQENEGNNDIRLIAGVNSLYYSAVGFEIEAFENGVSGGVNEVSSRTVFESIVSGGESVTAQGLGYKYLAAFVINELPESVADNSYVLIRSYTVVNGNKHYDDTMKLVVTSNGYYFDNEGSVYRNNFNGVKVLPTEWKLAGGSSGTASVTAKGELEFIQNTNEKTFLYLNQYVGEEYVLQFDVAVTDVKTGIGAYFAPLHGYNDSNNYGGVTVRAESYTPQGWIERISNGSWISPDDGKISLSELGGLLEKGKVYTASLACKKTETGTNVAFFIDGTLVKQYAYADYDNEGYVGICSKGVSMLIDNVIVKNGDYAEDSYFNYEKSFKNDMTLPSDWTAVDTHAKGSVEINNVDALKLEATGDQLLMAYLNSELTDKNGAAVYDYVIEADIILRDWDSATRYFGLTFRQNGGEDKDFVLAALRVRGQGWVQGNNKSANNYVTDGITLPSYVNDTTAVFTKGQSIKLKLVVEGDNVEFYLDGTLIGSGTKPSSVESKYTTGTVGIASKGVDFDVDKFTVTTVGDDPEILFSDDFTETTDYTEDWTVYSTTSTNHSVSLAEKSGKLAVNETGGTVFTHAILDSAKVAFDDYTFSADTTVTASGNYYGLVARYTNNGGKNYALAYVRNNGNGAIEFMSPSGWVSGYVYSFNLGKELVVGTVYNLKVTCEGNKIAFYVDNVKVAEGDMPTGFETGTVGVGAKGICIEVDNVKVSKGIELFEIKDAENPTTRIRVATFNIGDFSTASGSANIGVDKGNGTDTTKQEYIDVFKKVDADIWGLQEDSQYFNGDTKEAPNDAIYGEVLPYYERRFTGGYNGKAFASDFEVYGVEQVYYNAAVTSYAPEGTTAYGHPWFLAGKVMVDGKEITLITLHFDWACKERRFQQIDDVIAYAQKQEYAIILGDFNPENYVNGTKVADPNDEHYVNGSEYVNMYQVDWKIFTDAGFEPANGGRFGAYETLMSNGTPRGGFPWDSVFVSSNIKIANAYPVYESWMSDHAIFAADLEIN